MGSSIEAGAHILLEFSKKVQNESSKLFSRKLPNNVYLIKSPTLDEPDRVLWRVKKQHKGIVYLQHFDFLQKEIAFEIAKRINLMTKAEFVEFVRITCWNEPV